MMVFILYACSTTTTRSVCLCARAWWGDEHFERLCKWSQHELVSFAD